MPLVIGVDPGTNGGIAMLQSNETARWVAKAAPLPKTQTKRPELDLIEFVYMVRCLIDEFDEKPLLAVVESPPYIPTNGGFATRSLSKNWGMVLGVLATYAIPLLQPGAKLWKSKVLASFDDKNKEAAIQYVLAKYDSFKLPTLTPKSKKYHDGVADAICVADYAFISGEVDERTKPSE